MSKINPETENEFILHQQEETPPASFALESLYSAFVAYS